MRFEQVAAAGAAPQRSPGVCVAANSIMFLPCSCRCALGPMTHSVCFIAQTEPYTLRIQTFTPLLRAHDRIRSGCVKQEVGGFAMDLERAMHVHPSLVLPCSVQECLPGRSQPHTGTRYIGYVQHVGFVVQALCPTGKHCWTCLLLARSGEARRAECCYCWVWG